MDFVINEPEQALRPQWRISLCPHATAALSLVNHRAKPANSRSISNFSEIDAAQDDAGRVAFEVASDEFFRRALFDPITQSQELLFALMRRRP